jgi:hypothetical protein
MPDLVQVANDLKDMPDQWLAQQMQQPSGSVPPWLVASELARRERLRSGATRAQAPTSSVSQDLIKSLYARIPPTAGLMPQQQPPGAVPPGMPPVNLTPGGSTFGGPTPGTPPANFRMPARTMAEGGEVDDNEDDGGGEDNAILQAINAMRQSGGDTPLESMPAGAGGSRLLTQPTRQSVLGSLGPAPAPAPATRPTAAAAAPVSPIAAATQPIAAGARDQKGLLSFARKQGAIDGYIDKYSAQFGVSPEVIRAMVTHESGRDPNAVSKKGALGLMQLMPATAKQLGVNPLNPEQNIKGGTQYYAQLLNQFGDQRLALAAYNAGPGRVVQNGNQVPTYTEPYVNNVLNTANALRVQSGLPPLDKLPVGDLASRLLQPTPQPGPGQTVASTTTTEAPEEEVGTTSENEAAPQAAAAPNSPAPPTPLAARLQGSIWRPPEPEDLKYAKKREADLQTQTDALLKNFKAYDPDSAWSQDAVDKTKNIVRSFLGAPPDDTRWTQAMQTLMGQAQEMMHPSFGNALIQFGAGLMASRSHNFGVAVGEASLLSMGQQEKEQQQGRALFLQAMNAGIHLQDRTNAYQEKLGQLAFEVQRSQQTGNIDEEKRQLDVIRATQKELQDAHKDRATAQTAYDKTMSVPYATQMQAEGLLAQHPEIPRDPSLSPQDQIQRDAPQLLPQLYPTKTTAGSGSTAQTQELRAEGILGQLKEPRDPKYATAVDQLRTTHPDRAGEVTVAPGRPESQENKNAAQFIADSIENGTQSPMLTGMYHMGPLVRAELSKRNVNLSAMQMDWQSIQHYLTTLNAPQQVRLRQNIQTLRASIPKVRQLYDEWQQTGLPSGYKIYNRAALMAATNLPGEQGKAAQNLLSQINDMSAELGGVFMGGNGNTDHSLQLGAENLKGEWNPETFNGALKLIEDNMKIRYNSIMTTEPMGVRPGSPYLTNLPGGGNNQNPPADNTVTTQPPPRPAAIPADAEAQYSASRKQWRYRTKGSKEWQTLQ